MVIVGIYPPGSAYDYGTVSTHIIRRPNIRKLVLTLQRPDIFSIIDMRICSRSASKLPIQCFTLYIDTTPREITLSKSSDIAFIFFGPRINQPLPANGIYKVANVLEIEQYDINNTLIDTTYIDAYIAQPAPNIINPGRPDPYININYILLEIPNEAAAVTERICFYERFPPILFSASGYDADPLQNYIDPKEVIGGRGITCIKPHKYILVTAARLDIAEDYYLNYQIRTIRIVGKTPSTYTSTL